MTEIQTVGRRRLAVRAEEGNVKIDILLEDKRIATLDLEQPAAAELERQIGEVRDKPRIWKTSPKATAKARPRKKK